MNDLERQLQAVPLAAPSEALDRRLDAAFSAAADSSEGGARCPPLGRLGALSLPNGQRASALPSEFSNQRVEVNAFHLRSPESGRTQAPAGWPRRRRVTIYALLAGLGAAAAVAGFILLATRPAPLIPPSPSESAVVYHLEPTGLMRQFLTETPASQRSLPRFTVGVGSPALFPTTVKSNPSS